MLVKKYGKQHVPGIMVKKSQADVVGSVDDSVMEKNFDPANILCAFILNIHNTSKKNGQNMFEKYHISKLSH